MHTFSVSSLQKMVGVKEILREIMTEVLSQSPFDFKITEGLRTLERQKMLVASGKSWTMKSKHLIGDAVDICIIIDNKACWDHAPYLAVSKIFKEVAISKGVNVRWGGDFISKSGKPLVDAVHFELN